jgi:hypothetical protein
MTSLQQPAALKKFPIRAMHQTKFVRSSAHAHPAPAHGHHEETLESSEPVLSPEKQRLHQRLADETDIPVEYVNKPELHFMMIAVGSLFQK